MIFSGSMTFFIACVVVCTWKGLSACWALFAGYMAFACLAAARGCGVRQLVREFWLQVRQVKGLLAVLLFLGVLTASWRAGGVLAFMVYCGVDIIFPKMFLLIAFLASALTAYLIGTSFGVAGIMGSVFMTVGMAGGADPLLTAGAVLSGVFFGDRTSPVSSSFLTIQTITGESSSEILPVLAKNSVPAMAVCTVLYGILSFFFPLQSINDEALHMLAGEFTFSPWLLLPAAVMLTFPLLRIPNLAAMMLSAGSACLMAVLMQGESLMTCLKFCVFGYTAENPQVGEMMDGGGMAGMAEICLIVCFAVNLLPVMEKCGMKELLEPLTEKIVRSCGRTTATVGLVALTNGLFCNQTVPLYFAWNCMEKYYGGEKDKDQFVTDVSDSNITGGLFPWSVSCSVPLMLMGAGVGCLPFAFYLWIQPLTPCIAAWYRNRKKSRKRKAASIAMTSYPIHRT